MSVSSLILPNGKVLLQQISSSTVTLPAHSPYVFGNLKSVSNLSDNFSIGQNVVYDPSSQQGVAYQSVSYFLINESDIKLVFP